MDREEIEKLVQTRTEELSKLNQALQSEIEERKKTEETMKNYAEKLEWSNRELQEFAYVASHDLQEPLRKIQAFGDRLKAKFMEGLSDDGRDYLDRMQSAAKRMQALINASLAYSLVTRDAQPFVPVNLGDVTQDVLSNLEVLIEQTSGHVELGDLPTIEADPTQMIQLFQNLIGNALKFHRKDEQPMVKLYSQLIEVSKRRSGKRHPRGKLCQIYVEDNGIGFDDKYLDRIFAPFKRLHPRSQYAGTGIGLAICRKIVEWHRGSITAESKQGKGSTFIVTLPFKQPKRRSYEKV